MTKTTSMRRSAPSPTPKTNVTARASQVLLKYPCVQYTPCEKGPISQSDGPNITCASNIVDVPKRIERAAKAHIEWLFLLGRYAKDDMLAILLVLVMVVA